MGGAVYLLGGSWKYHRTFLIDMVEAMMSSEVYSREARGARGLPTMEKNLPPCLISVTIGQWGLLARYLLAPVQSNFHNTLFQLVMWAMRHRARVHFCKGVVSVLLQSCIDSVSNPQHVWEGSHTQTIHYHAPPCGNRRYLLSSEERKAHNWILLQGI